MCAWRSSAKKEGNPSFFAHRGISHHNNIRELNVHWIHK